VKSALGIVPLLKVNRSKQLLKVRIMNGVSKNCLTVLVVEDVDWIRTGMKMSLQAYGHRVVEATDNEEAILVAERFRPDLILTEEDLPTFDALMRSAREHPALMRIPVVIVNPDAEDGDSYDDAIILMDYSQVKHALTIPRNS
jgi:CheY-like chemotaxis protein